MHNVAINAVIAESSRLLKQCILAQAAHTLGQERLSGFPDSVCVKTAIGVNVEIEPIPLGELKEYAGGLPGFLMEVFHGKLLQVWHDCLSELFKMLVDLHFAGKRRFSELKKREVTVDFRLDVPFETQIKERLRRDFDFERYSDKVKLLNGVFNPSNEQEEHFARIASHVQIRNSFHHRGGILDQFLLSELGCHKLVLLDAGGIPREYGIGDRLGVSIPEFEALRRSLLVVGQVWRKWDG